jgi:adenylosuccinate lyase
MKVVAAAVAPMMMRLNARFNLPNVETVGFTHWQVAAPISWAHRLHAWLEPINYLLATRPAIHAKKFGGPVGDAASLKLLVPSNVLDDNPFDWGPFDLDHPNNPFPLQSSDHTCESQAINWVCGLASQVHKIALDLRFLASQQLLTINRPAGHAGSSSMPHKLNPYKWEKVCAITRSVATCQAEMWDVSAHNSLERTLDGSWQLKNLLFRAFHSIAYALQEMAAVDVYVDFTAGERAVSLNRDRLSSDRDLTRRIIAGESRWSAYQQAISSVNQPTKSK